MSLELGTRRGFLVGALALVTAPALVRAGSLMPVKFVDVYDTRCLVDYIIGTDQYVLRVDRSLDTLRRYPQVKEISLELAKLITGPAPIYDERPAPGVQRFAQMAVTSPELRFRGIVL